MKGEPRVFDTTLLVLLVALVVLLATAWLRGGRELAVQGLSGGGALLGRYALVIAVSFLAAGVAEVLVPREAVRETLGGEAGLRGILLAAGAGIITPAGPFVSMPIAAVLLRSGAAPSSVVAFLTGWSLLALHRFVVWEVPILGLRFALTRYAICLGLPVVAGLVTRVFLR